MLILPKSVAVYLAIFALTAATTSLPQSAVIIPVPAEQGDMSFPIGNVKVTFTDGHTEMWTKQGRAAFPQVSSAGIVGFALFTKLIPPDPDFNDLRLVWPDEHHKDYASKPDRPIIEQWGFADNEATIVLQTRGTHGPAEFLKYNIATGKLIAQADVGVDSPLPDWAQPYADKN
jgi:hypothetical protein